MRVRELIEILEDLDPEAEVLVAVQPSWPFEHALDGVAVREDFTEMEDGDEEEPAGDRWTAPAGRLPRNDVFIVAGDQLRYGSPNAWNVTRRS